MSEIPEDIATAASGALVKIFGGVDGVSHDDWKIVADAILSERESRFNLTKSYEGTIIRLQTEVEALRDQSWQPIDTVPKDGTPILAYNPVFGVYNTGYVAQEPNESDRFPCGFSGWLGKWYCYPTHWRPLPSPPKP